ncbi:MAG: serine/threonine protein kinase, partial [Roseburia sp.]|nr:serine/threonine protein kinase [Roseburia sp.]
GSGLGVAAAARRSDAYEAVLEAARYTTDSADAVERYMEAVGIDAARGQAYHGYYDTVIEDGCFTDAEEAALLRLTVSRDKPLQRFAEDNPRAYADFCFEMGNAYWYYYVHEESRQSGAVPWFESAMRGYETDAEKAVEYRRCRLYVEIGGFHKRIAAAQIDGSDAGMYGAYWERLSELKALNDEAPDRDLITLRMYREIAGRAAEYAKYLRDDGVSQETVRGMLDDIERDMRCMEETATDAVRGEISSIRRIMELADGMIRSSYRQSVR